MPSPRTSPLPSRVMLLGILAVAAANFAWQLGSSSLFVDEIQALDVAAQPIRDVLHATSVIEVTPPAYFYFMHEWIARIGSASAWETRLPSAICGALLVAVIIWLGWLVSGRRAVALCGGAIAALSPFVLEYAQLAQGYIVETLAVAFAVAAALQAAQAERHRGRWLLASGVAAVLALWLHYTAALAIVPLCIWGVTRHAFRPGWRIAFVGACAAAQGAVIPLIIAQHRAYPDRAGVAETAKLTATAAEQVFATPFVGRTESLGIVGTLVMATAVVVLGLNRWSGVHERRLVAAIAFGPPLVLLILSAIGGGSFLGHLMLPRYAAAAAPLMIVVVALAVVSARPRALGVLLAAGTLAVCLAGTLSSHRRSGFYLDARDVARYIHSRQRSGDVVLATDGPGESIPFGAYGLFPRQIGTAATNMLVEDRRHRLWLIGQLRNNSVTASTLLHAARLTGYSATTARVFPAVTPIGVVLEVPRRRSPGG